MSTRHWEFDREWVTGHHWNSVPVNATVTPSSFITPRGHVGCFGVLFFSLSPWALKSLLVEHATRFEVMPLKSWMIFRFIKWKRWMTIFGHPLLKYPVNIWKFQLLKVNRSRNQATNLQTIGASVRHPHLVKRASGVTQNIRFYFEILCISPNHRSLILTAGSLT